MTYRILLAALLGCPLAAFADPDWPQFRGPKRDDVSTDTGLLKSWPDKGPPLAWKAEGVGDGFSSVAVVGDKVLTMGDEKETCYVFAVSRKNGKKLWEAKVGKSGGGGGYPGPRSTPTVDGDSVYALGQHGDLVCVGLANGKQKWHVNLPKDFAGSSGGWAYAESPLVDGDKVVCTPGGSEATMIALDKKTGKPIWKGHTPDGESAGYSSIVISNAGGTKQYVTLTSTSVVSFNAKSGAFSGAMGPRKTASPTTPRTSRPSCSWKTPIASLPRPATGGAAASCNSLPPAARSTPRRFTGRKCWKTNMAA